MKPNLDDEPINHQLWVISYADMVTLLFALFVVLYSLGEVKLRKLRELRQSLAFAFNFDGDSLYDTEMVLDRGDAGAPLDGLRLVFEQDESLREQLLMGLPDRFEELTGRGVEVTISDDGLEYRSTLNAFYRAGSASIRPEVKPWLVDVCSAAMSMTAHIRVRIEAPNVVIGEDTSGRSIRSSALCHTRLEWLLRFLPLIPRVLVENITTEFDYVRDLAGDWERVGTISFSFSNVR